jgi:hypothetical protein
MPRFASLCLALPRLLVSENARAQIVTQKVIKKYPRLLQVGDISCFDR